MGSLIELLTKISVRIHSEDDSDEEWGTGTLISNGTTYYVLTAGHCIKKTNGTVFNSTDIDIFSYAGDTELKVDVISVLPGYDLSDTRDFAVIEVQNPNIEFNFADNIKRCDTQLDEEAYCFYGFTEPNKKGRLYQLRRTGKTQWHLVDDAITGQPLKAYTLMGGNSGAGVFFVKTGILYHVGYVKRMIDDCGTQSDLIVYPTKYFDSLLPECTKENNLFKLVEKWTELEQKEIDEELMEEYRTNNVEYLNNLNRKMKVLFPKGDEAQAKSKVYLGHFLRGLQLNAEISKTAPVARALKNRKSSAFKKFCDDRSEYVEDKDAREDLKNINTQIKNLANEVLDLDDQGQTVAQGYADYSVAEKLLDCTLDYKKEDNDQ